MRSRECGARNGTFLRQGVTWLHCYIVTLCSGRLGRGLGIEDVVFGGRDDLGGVHSLLLLGECSSLEKCRAASFLWIESCVQSRRSSFVQLCSSLGLRPHQQKTLKH